MPKNIFITQTLELKKLSSAMAKEMACDVCEKPASAVKLCTTCIQRLCDECCKSHEKIRTTRTHRLFSLKRSGEESDEVAKLMRSYCKEHDERIVEMYCDQCKEVICLLCFALKHGGHSCLHVDEVAGMKRQQIEKDISIVASVVDKDNGLLNEIEKERKELEMSAEKAKGDNAKRAEDAKANIVAKINNQVKEFNAKVDQVVGERKRKIEETRTEIQTSTALKQGFCNYLRQMHKNGTSVDLARDAEKLHTRAEEIQPAKHKRKESVHIQFDSAGRYRLAGVAMHRDAHWSNR